MKFLGIASTTRYLEIVFIYTIETWPRNGLCTVNRDTIFILTTNSSIVADSIQYAHSDNRYVSS